MTESEDREDTEEREGREDTTSTLQTDTRRMARTHHDVGVIELQAIQHPGGGGQEGGDGQGEGQALGGFGSEDLSLVEEQTMD